MRTEMKCLAAQSQAAPVPRQVLTSLPRALQQTTSRQAIASHSQLEALRSSTKNAQRVLTCSASSALSEMEPVVQPDATTTAAGTSTGWEIRLLYDGDCHLCMREVAMLMSRDDSRGKIDFVDIAASTYDPADNQGIDYSTAMHRIHGILPDGSIVTGLEVLQRCYDAVGLGWLRSVTSHEPFGTVANAVYEMWAKNRLRLTGRPDLAVILEGRRPSQPGATCDSDDFCELSFGPSNE